MAITFPTSIDTLSNPTSTDLLENATAALDHDVQHSNANDAIEALEAKVGADSSAVTTSHDYKLSGVTGSDKAVSKTGTETLTNKTLTSPVINVTSDATGDIYYRSAGGLFTRLGLGTNGYILTSNGTIPAWTANTSASEATYSTSGISKLDANVRYYAADAGANDTYAITLTDAPSAYVTGQEFSFKANTANTGAATLNVNSLGAKTIVKGVNTTLSDNDILAGQHVKVRYDGTNMVMMSPVSTNPSPSIFKNGTTTYDLSTASGTVNIAHGLGIIPKFVRFTYYMNSTNGTPWISYGSGVYNGTTNSTTYMVATEAMAFGSAAAGNGLCIHFEAGSGTFQEAVATFDATNIILTWTKTSTPNGTGYIMWEATA